MKDRQYTNKRNYYRIRYPHSYRPKVRIEGEEHENDIVELSERGVRFLYKGASQLSKGLELCVNMIFYDDEHFQLEGEILRIEKEDVIMRFSGSLPLSRIMKEQRYLRTRYVGYM